MAPQCKVACCHVAPILFNAQATTDKCKLLIDEASKEGAELVVFPEAFISGFPIWSSCISPVEATKFFEVLTRNSIYADGEEIQLIRQAAEDRFITVSVGITEKSRYHEGTLWNSNLIIGPTGDVLCHHRKAMLEFTDKLTWTPGDGHGLSVVDVPISLDAGFGSAKVGALISDENQHPLARYNLMAQGEQIHISTWPAKSPKHAFKSSDDYSHDVRSVMVNSHRDMELNRKRVAEHCFEANCFGVVCAGFLSTDVLIHLIEVAPEHTKQLLLATLGGSAQAKSIFFRPSGEPLQAYTLDKDGQHVETQSLRDEPGILYATIDLEDTVKHKPGQAALGKYYRPDVFNFQINATRLEPARFLKLKLAGEGQAV